jgi:small conductance mechanosensitive channel
VGNSSQDWAAALLDFAFAYENDVEVVQGIIQDVAKQMRADKAWGKDMTSEVDIWGMQHISGEQFIIRASVKTLPNRQWAVARELRKRCKEAFDARGINLMSASKINLAN